MCKQLVQKTTAGTWRSFHWNSQGTGLRGGSQYPRVPSS